MGQSLRDWHLSAQRNKASLTGVGWGASLRQHLTVFGLAAAFGLGAYTVVRLLIYASGVIGKFIAAG